MKRFRVNVSAVEIGTVLMADSGFTCLKTSELCVVNSNPQGELYVRCDEGKHYLVGQLDIAANYIGFTKK